MRVSSGLGCLILACLACGCAEAPDGAKYSAVEPTVPQSATDGGKDGGADGGEVTDPVRDSGPTDARAPEDASDAAAIDASSDGGATTDGSLSDAAASAPDAASDGATSMPDGGCATGTVAVVAGNGSSASAVVQTGATWSAAASLAGSLKSRPSVVATATGFTAVGVAADDGLRFTTLAGSAWSPLAAVASGVTALDEARLVVLGGAAQLVFQAKGGVNDTRYFAATAASGGWTTPEAIGSGGDISFGPRAPAATTSGANLLIAQVGGNSMLYARERSGSTWGASAQIGSDTAKNDLPTAAVELSNGHLLAVYSTVSGGAQRLTYTTRVGSAWTGSAAVFDNGTNRAFSNDPLALLPMSAGRALLVFRGGDTNLYATTFDPVGVIPWTPPTAVTAQPVATASAPSLAAGTCGADAVVAFVDGTAVKLARLTGAAWSAPEAVPGVGAATFVGIASKP